HEALTFALAGAIAVLIKADGLVPVIAAQGVDRLVRCNGVQPGANRVAGLILVALEVQLEEGVLKDILRKAAIPEVACQVAIQLALVTANQCREGLAIALAGAEQQRFIRTGA